MIIMIINNNYDNDSNRIMRMILYYVLLCLYLLRVTVIELSDESCRSVRILLKSRGGLLASLAKPSSESPLSFREWPYSVRAVSYEGLLRKSNSSKSVEYNIIVTGVALQNIPLEQSALRGFASP